MITAKEIKAGITLRINNKLYLVVSFDYHSAGKMVTSANAQLRDLSSGHLSVKHFKPDEKVDDVHVDKKNMEFLYVTDNEYTFMDPDDYEQFTLSKEVLGEAAAFLKPNTLVPLMIFEDKAIAANLPDTVILEVSLTPPPASGESNHTPKEAELENGLKILVPPFIKSGDKVKVDIENKKFLERIKED